jgi:hypothetical protein
MGGEGGALIDALVAEINQAGDRQPAFGTAGCLNVELVADRPSKAVRKSEEQFDPIRLGRLSSR